MANEPKKRHSRARQGKRRSAISLDLNGYTVCSNCKNVIKPHTVCPTCGYYKGKQVVARA